MATRAATDVPVNITHDTTWTASSSPYVVSADMIVAAGATLTIEPGAVVKIATSTSITVAGTLAAQGTAAAPITFTSVGDSADSASWSQLIIAAGATANFSHTDVRYGGAPQSGGGGDLVPPLDGLIENHGTLSFTDSTIAHTSFSGGLASDGTLTFSRSSAHDLHTKTALTLGGTAAISESSFGTDESISATNASLTLSTISVTEPVVLWNSNVHNGGGNTEPILLKWESLAGDATFPALPFVNVPDSDVDVNAGTTLTIAPGAIVKAYAPIHVYGALVVGAAGGATTTLTSAADDAVGGDTDGADADPTSPDHAFVGIIAEEGSTVRLVNTLLRYAGDAYGGYLLAPCGGNYDAPQDACAGAILNQGGTVSIADSTFEHATYNDLMQTAGTTTITGSRFATSTRFAYLTGGSLTAHGNSIALAETGVQNDGTTDADATSNWWGSASGPHNADTNPEGTGPEISAHVLFSPWLTSDPFAPPPAPKYDNVLFLPGIEGSTLYDESAKREVWLPGSDEIAESLRLNTDGTSINPNITASGILSKANLAQGYHTVYGDLLEDMEKWESAYHIIATSTPYDWRLGYDTLLTNGRKLTDGHISYLESPETGHDPYLIETLKQLAASSATGKVTIIAHSNGGLLAKALMQKLGATTTKAFIDNVILVASPQLGTPDAIGALLHGHEAGIVGAITNEEARDLAQNMPMTYNLLPSTPYFTYADDPVVAISSTLPSWTSQYGSAIHWAQGLNNFISDSAGTRAVPTYDNLADPQVGNADLLAQAQETHASLDTWTPPAGVHLYTIAGWGNETVAGIAYEKLPLLSCFVQSKLPSFLKSGDCGSSSHISYAPQVVIDGDGTVVAPSALWANGAEAKRYWVNLERYNAPLPQSYPLSILRTKHADIFSVPQLRTLLASIVAGSSTDPLSQYISTSQPTYTGDMARLHFILHSPLTLGFLDANGNYTGATATSTVFNIPGVEYQRFGEVQWLSVPKSLAGTVVMHGIGTGSFSLDVEERAGNTIVATTTFAAIPSATSTTATLVINPSIDTTAGSTLNVDTNSDGKYVISVTPEKGKMVVYEPPAPKASNPTTPSTSPKVNGSLPVFGKQALTPNPLPRPAETSTTSAATSTKTATTIPTYSNPSTTTPPIREPVAAALPTRTKPERTTLAVRPTKKSVPADPISRTLVPEANPMVAATEQAIPQQSLTSELGNSVYNVIHTLMLALTKWL